jgi:hypothetical protein
MKKITILALAVLTVLPVFSQGTLQFQNGATTAIFTNYSALGGPRGKAAPGYLNYALLWGGTAAAAQSGANITATVSNSATAGVIAGSANFAIVGTNPGDTDYFQFIGWQASYGTGYAGYLAAYNAGGFFGYSAVLPFVLGPSSGPGTVIFSSTDPTKFQGFDVVPSPEPTTLALGGIGAAALVLIGRRKK